ASGYGVLVVEVPLSERRPHWVREGGQDVAYIRAGEHSGRMSNQTLLDMASRGPTSRGEVVGLEKLSGPSNCENPAMQLFLLNPEVCLTAVSFCEHWAFELQAARGAGSLTPHEGDSTVRVFGPDRVAVTAGEPLFPGRPTRVAEKGIAFRLDRGAGPV